MADSSTFGVQVHPDENTPVAVLTGEIDALAAAELRSQLLDLVGRGSGLRLDLSQVTFLDSSGLGLIAELFRTVGPQSGALRVVAPSAEARRVLELGGLGALLPSAG